MTPIADDPDYFRGALTGATELTPAEIEHLHAPSPGQLALTEYRLELPYGSSPFLHANQRLSRMEHAARVAKVRRDVGFLAKHHKIGTGHPHITVGLEWRPAMRRRRDGAENLSPLVKACVDGLVQPGVAVVADDTPDQVTRTMPVLLEPDRATCGLWLLVSVP